MSQKRKPRKLLEADEKQWARWERFRLLEGVTFATFARRALEQRCASLDELEQAIAREPALAVRLPGLQAVHATEARRDTQKVRRAPVRKTSPKKASRKATKKRRGSRG